MADQELINLLIEKTAEYANENKQSYIQEVACWISKVFLTETKTDVTFEYDPPWDASGTTYNTENPFDIKDYTSLDTFIENELNGSSHPSFVSGMGMFHDYYSSELDELTDTWVSTQFKETVEKLLHEENDVVLKYAQSGKQKDTDTERYRTANEIIELIIDDNRIVDFIFIEYPIKLKQEAGKTDMKFLLKLGRKQAEEEIRQEAITRQAVLAEQAANREKAEKYWRKICMLHQIRYQKKVPQRIEKPYFDEYVYPILEDEYNKGEDVLTIRLLGECFNFSNSVAFKLSQFKKQ